LKRLENYLSFVIGKASQQVMRASREALEPNGVTLVQFAILKALWERDELRGTLRPPPACGALASLAGQQGRGLRL
jgi:hypothetical protein